jgi:7-cyano-7-deazaguanine synthase
MIPKTVLHLLSGGLDSTVLLYDLVHQGHHVHAVMFDYGQTHVAELNFAAEHCDRVGVNMTTLRLPRLRGSQLTDGAVKSYVVPNRNAVLLSIAANLAVVAGAESVTFGSNMDDAEGFPDCRRPFVDAVNRALVAAEVPVEVCAPYIDTPKTGIVAIGRALGVRMDRTWSCYSAGPEPCGSCPACQKRSAALR